MAETYEVIFNNDTGSVYLQKNENGETQRVLDLPRTRTKYELIFSILDNIISRTLQKDFTFETDQIARYLREAFSFLVVKIAPQEKEHKLRLTKPLNQFGIEEFDICKRYLDGAKGGKATIGSDKLPETRAYKKKLFLGIQGDSQNDLHVLDKYYSDDSDKEINKPEQDFELTTLQQVAGHDQFTTYLSKKTPPKKQPAKTHTLKHSISSDALEDLTTLRSAFQNSLEKTGQEPLCFDKEGYLIDPETKQRIIHTHFVVAGFRGINHMNRFTDTVRRLRRKSEFQQLVSKSPYYSEAVLMHHFDFYRDSDQWIKHLTDSVLQTNLAETARILQFQLLNLKQKDFVLVIGISADTSEGEGGVRLFSNLLYAIQHIYSNGIIKQQRCNRLLLGDNNTISFNLPNAFNPFVSESEEAYHAMRYACGLKPIYEPAACKPHYHPDGKPAFPYLGEISISLRSIGVVASEYERHLLRELTGLTRIKPSQEIAPELEATGFGFIPKDEIVYSEVIKCPNFKGEYKTKYAAQFGLSKTLFDLFKSKITKASSTNERRQIELLVLEWLCCFKSAFLMEKAIELAGKSTVIFRHPKLILSKEIPNRNQVEPDNEHQNMLTKLEQHLFQKTKKDQKAKKDSFLKAKLTTSTAKFYAFNETQIRKALEELGYQPLDIQKFMQKEDKLRTPPSSEKMQRKPLLDPGKERNSPNSPYKPPKPTRKKEDLPVNEIAQSFANFSLSNPIRPIPKLVLSTSSTTLSREKKEHLSTLLANMLSDWEANLDTKITIDLTQLDTEAEVYSFKCEDVPADGNCFFHACVAQLKKVPELNHLNHKQLREMVTSHFIENLNLYREFIEDDDFISKIARGGTWANGVVVQALARTLNINIFIINSDRSKPIIFRRENPKSIIYLGYLVNIHYVSLTPSAKHSNININDLVNNTEIDRIQVTPIETIKQDRTDLLPKFGVLAPNEPDKKAALLKNLTLEDYPDDPLPDDNPNSNEHKNLTPT